MFEYSIFFVIFGNFGFEDLVLRDLGTSQLTLQDGQKVLVGHWASGIDLLALLGTSQPTNMGSQIKLNSGVEDVDEGLAVDGGLDVGAEVLVDKRFHGSGAGRLSVELADEGLGAVIAIVEGSLDHNLLNLNVILNGTSPPVTTTSIAAATMTTTVTAGQSIADLEADEG